MLDRRHIRSHGILLFVIVYLASSHQWSPALAHPKLLASLSLFICGFLLSQFRFWFAARLSKESPTPGKAPVTECNGKHGARTGNHVDTPKGLASLRSISPSDRKYLVFPLALAICLRLEVFCLNVFTPQLSLAYLEGFVPFVVAFLKYRRQRGLETLSQNHQEDNTDIDEWGIPKNIKRNLPATTTYIVSTLGLGFAYSLCPWAFPVALSTYIHSTGFWTHIFPVVLPLAALGLDTYILLKIASILRSQSPQENYPGRLLLLGSTFAYASVFIASYGLINVILQPQYWYWFLPTGYGSIASLFLYSILFIVLVLNSLQILLEHGALHLSFSVAYLSLCTLTLRYVFREQQFEPLASKKVTIAFLSLLNLGTAFYIAANSATGKLESANKSIRKTRTQLISYFSLLIVIPAMLGRAWPGATHFNAHPIEDLVFEALGEAEAWLAHASQGLNLETAVGNYKQRYERSPPPGFDMWYKYATERSTLVVDDYDSIHKDLQPFWAIPPSDLRRQVQRLSSDNANDIARFEIRNGELKVGKDPKRKQPWAIDAFLSMASNFSQYLPDMDLAVNLNDEPRIAVPFNVMQSLLEQAAPPVKLPAEPRPQWSVGRAETWGQKDWLTPSAHFKSYLASNSFAASTVGCPPDSLSRNYDGDPKTLCMSCSNGYSDGGIIFNWTAASSPCDQPDLRNLHGFYASPVNLKITHELLPVFSHSKVTGFADILYPSPADYTERIKYFPSSDDTADVPFMEKQDTLFWRGSTTEGFSHHGLWQGMLRQRLVNLANNLTTSSVSPPVPFVLPHHLYLGKFNVQYPRDPYKHLITDLDISFSSIDRAATPADASAQQSYFGFTPPIDFQEHWRYRYLFDTDGRSASPRFLPFLRSRCLPFKTGIFRSWYDERLTPWAHFVPIDTRLHGLFSTLAFFGGSDGEKSSRTLRGRVGMGGKVKIAEAIADRGREWAGKVIRKEDMEIYLFRLLLEWGRLTDDDRDNLGFVMKEEGQGKASA